MAHRLSFACGLAALLALLPRITGCSSSGSGADACAEAGGECLVGGGGPRCAKVGPQDCNPDENPGGFACCLELLPESDAAPDAPLDAPAEDAESASSCPPDVPCGCSCPTTDDAGACTCGHSSVPACPAALQSEEGMACTPSGTSCMNCIGGAAGVLCSCLEIGLPDSGGAVWQCIGTGQGCTGGTFHG